MDTCQFKVPEAALKEDLMLKIISWNLFGEYLCQLRKANGMTQILLADHLGCTRSYLWRLEHSKRIPSKLFLRLVRDKFPLNAKERIMFAAFEQMIEYRCNFLEVEN